MKPLTIKELKALEVGDWVWVKLLDENRAAYFYKSKYSDNEEFIAQTAYLGIEKEYSDYGTKWIAYKNKEQAEAKCEIVEFSCKVGDKIYVPWVWEGQNGIMTLTCNSITLTATINYIKCYDFETDDIDFANMFSDGTFQFVEYRYIWFTDKSEAERRLAELKGEKK